RPWPRPACGGSACTRRPISRVASRAGRRPACPRVPLSRWAEPTLLMTAAEGSRTEAHHQHRDVQGGWLRPAVFGAMDGLVTNVSLIAGVGGGGGSPRPLGLAGPGGPAGGAVAV